MWTLVRSPYSFNRVTTKPRTPKEIAKAAKKKKTYSFSLVEPQVEALKELADKEGVPVSELVDEAIGWYLKAIQENGNHK